MDKNLATPQYSEQEEKRRALYKEVFTTPQGKRVLQDLREQYYDVYIRPDDMLMHEVGCRNVILGILETIGEV